MSRVSQSVVSLRAVVRVCLVSLLYGMPSRGPVLPTCTCVYALELSTPRGGPAVLCAALVKADSGTPVSVRACSCVVSSAPSGVVCSCCGVGVRVAGV